jgi:DegV family protein with EDD domain
LSRVKVVTDSSAYLEPEDIARLGISVVPIRVHLEGKTYREGVDITPQEFLRLLSTTRALPTTSAPSVQEFTDLYLRLGKQTDQILSIHVSSKLEGVYAAALAASTGLLVRSRIVVIDSLSVSLGLGILVKAAAEAAAAGRSLEEIVRMVRGMIPHLYAVFFIESLGYLLRSKRISVPQTVLGTMFNIKPLLSVDEGELIPLEKVRTRERAVDKLYEFITEFSHVEQMAIVQANFDKDTATLLERLELTYPEREHPVITYPPSLAAHLGPSAMGVVVYEGMHP